MVDYVSIAQKTSAARAAQAEPAPGNGFQQEADSAEESWTEVRANASALLNREGVRIINVEGRFAIGVWSDRDSPEIREALRVLDMGELSIRYLDGDNVRDCYKERDVEGEPVPIAVLRAMEADPDAPWVIRGQMLATMGWSPNGVTWDEWRTATRTSSNENVPPESKGSGPAPEEKVGSVSQYAVNAINAVIDTQLGLCFEPDPAEDFAKDRTEEPNCESLVESDRKGRLE
ncbi:MAG: hypothetical protein WB676_13665 [Bryobacteraceae bacterium]